MLPPLSGPAAPGPSPPTAARTYRGKATKADLERRLEELARRLGRYAALAEEAEPVRLLLGPAWPELVERAREWETLRGRRLDTLRQRIKDSPAIDDAQRRRLLLVDDALLAETERLWKRPFAVAIGVHVALKGKPVSFDAVRALGKVLGLA